MAVAFSPVPACRVISGKRRLTALSGMTTSRGSVVPEGAEPRPAEAADDEKPLHASERAQTAAIDSAASRPNRDPQLMSTSLRCRNNRSHLHCAIRPRTKRFPSKIREPPCIHSACGAPAISVRPDIRAVVYDHSFEGHRAWFRFAFKWRDPATGALRSRAGMQSYRIEAGKLAETWLVLQPLGSTWTDAVVQEHWTSPPPIK